MTCPAQKAARLVSGLRGARFWSLWLLGWAALWTAATLVLELGGPHPAWQSAWIVSALASFGGYAVLRARQGQAGGPEGGDGGRTGES